MKKLVFGLFAISFAASSAMASSAGLLGKWAGHCNQANFEATEFFATVTEFLEDGTAHSKNYVYDNNQCSGAEVRQDGKIDATYTATDTDLTVLFTIDSKAAELKGTYVVSPETLSFTPTSWIVDGQVQELPGKVELKRIH